METTNLDDFMSDLSQNQTSSLTGNYVFGDLLSIKERQFLVEHGTVRRLSIGQKLCIQNRLEHSIYVLLTGELEIVEELDNKSISLGKIQPGDLVGEIGALFSVPRIATVQASKPSNVLEVPANYFSKLLEDTPILHGAVYQRLYERSLKTALCSMPMFNNNSDFGLPELARMLKCWGIPSAN